MKTSTPCASKPLTEWAIRRAITKLVGRMETEKLSRKEFIRLVGQCSRLRDDLKELGKGKVK